MNFTTPDLCDDHPDKVSVLAPGFRNFGRFDRFYGEIATAKCADDNSMVRESLAQDGTGKVLVVDGGASMKRALLGDILTGMAINHHWAGIIINGCVRDVDAIADMDIGVQALGSHPMKTEKKGQGEKNTPVSFGSVKFMPGQFVYADNNGIIVSANSLL